MKVSYELIRHHVERESIKVQLTQKQEKEEETLTEKMKDLQMKDTNKHMEASVKLLDNHR
jgi:hypothetical protein